MRKITLILTMLWLMVAAAWAQEAVINNHIASVSVSRNHIVVVQVFDMTTGGRLTEYYLPIDRRFLMVDVKPRVSCEQKNFEYLNKWNPTASYEDKQGKCGLLPMGPDFQICFGVQRNAQKVYFVTYGLVNMMYSTAQGDVLEYPFINNGRDYAARKAELRISISGRKITDDDLVKELCGADGNVELRDGVIYITPKEGSTGVTTLPYRICFKKGTFPGLPEKNLRLNPFGSQVGPSPDGGANPMLADSFTPEELSSPMMKTNEPKSESGSWGLLDFIEKNPLTSVLIGHGILITLFFLIRKLIKMVI